MKYLSNWVKIKRGFISSEERKENNKKHLYNYKKILIIYNKSNDKIMKNRIIS
jgi:hypothetical protein